MRVNYRTDRIRSYMTSSESSSEEEIIGTDHFLSDHAANLYTHTIQNASAIPLF